MTEDLIKKMFTLCPSLSLERSPVTEVYSVETPFTTLTIFFFRGSVGVRELAFIMYAVSVSKPSQSAKMTLWCGGRHGEGWGDKVADMEVDTISTFRPNFTISKEFHNFDQISQFQPNFHNFFSKISQF